MRGWKRLAVAAVSITLGVGIIGAGRRGEPSTARNDCASTGGRWSTALAKAGMVGNLVLYSWELAKRQELHPDRNAARELLRANVDGLRQHLSPTARRWPCPVAPSPTSSSSRANRCLIRHV
ncbi:MAG: hypothetical protein IPH43_16050 [Xanthomonadales bacterium]|nr:hypothetical protein [Xanthomonadales bacterium]